MSEQRFEFRVCWRREHDKTPRRRLYQTPKGAESFARFLETLSWDEDDHLADWQVDHFKKLGNPTEVRVESRAVGVWEATHE
jgi:hypothetical protein